jgi:putative beta-lysine N-acetyltransferase
MIQYRCTLRITNVSKGEKSMEDRIENMGSGSIIQHGKLNNRIYLIKLGKKDCPGILDSMRKLALKEGYTKIFCKVPEWAAPLFFADGYLTEAIIPGFYQGMTHAFFLSKYLDSDRLLSLETDHMGEFSELLKNSYDQPAATPKDSIKIQSLGSKDVDQITDLYRKVFLSYPFPIHNPGYILKTMQENVHYFGARKKGTLVAISSAEIDKKGANAEMTDFATDPEFRGQKLGQLLLEKMEAEMRDMKIKTLYTIARLKSIPMNKVFLKHRYQYAGTLLRNTNISGSIESMNVFYKHIQ